MSGSGSAERWPRWADPAIAAGVAAVAVVDLSAMGSTPPPWQYATALTMATALAWRRRAPVVVLLIVLGGVLVHDLNQVPLNNFYAPLTIYPAFYAVGAHRALPVSAAAAGGGLVLLALSSVLEGLPVGDFLFVGLVCLGSWGAGAAIRRRIATAVEAHSRARLAEERQQLTAAAAVAEERARIARELHDVVAHSVSVMVMQAGALRRMLPTDQPKAVGVAETVERTGREALVELRRMLGLLRDDSDRVPLAPQPGLARIPELVESTEAAGVPVTLAMDEPPAALSPGVDLCAFRIVQESLTNVIKHAGPASVRVAVHFPPGSVAVEVVDDGRGGTPAPDGGHGLLGMRERVAVFGGRLSLGPEPDGGFAVRATLPVESR
ncbi:MAG TPA: sensor histidine kinase [Blastococcus sp.]|nr:sensor histidine kinase [Blastococcus sp.]